MHTLSITCLHVQQCPRHSGTLQGQEETQELQLTKTCRVGALEGPCLLNVSGGRWVSPI